MTPGPELFVVCKSCGSEVSPYITECPYCGARLRKRAPKIERDSPQRAARRVPRPTLGPLRPGEIPGIRADPRRRPYVSLTLVLLSALGLLALYIRPLQTIALLTQPTGGGWYRVALAPFLYLNVWYQFAAVFALGFYGWRLERRHGPVLVLALYLLGGIGAMALATAVQPDHAVLGGNGIGMAMLACWAIPDLIDARRGADYDGDLIATGVIAAVVLALPLGVPESSAVAGFAGLAVGALAGLALAGRSSRRL